VQFRCKYDGHNGNYGRKGLFSPKNLDVMDTTFPTGQAGNPLNLIKSQLLIYSISHGDYCTIPKIISSNSSRDIILFVDYLFELFQYSNHGKGI